MLQELADESENQGLKMNKSKTIKMMVENDTSVCQQTHIENVESNIYLGERYSTRDKNQDKEIQRRITAGWTAFAKHRGIFKGNTGTCLKRQVYILVRTSSNDIRRGNMGAPHPCKGQAGSRTNKDGKEYVNITYRDRKIKHLVKTKDKGHIPD